MKKKILILVAFVGYVAVSSAQQSAGNSLTPTKSLTVQEANQLNGNAQPIMKDGKPYSQWVADEKAKRQAEQNKVAAAQNANADIISVNAADARPTPAKPVPVVDASITAKKVDAVTKPLPEVPEQFKLAAATPWDATPTNNTQPINNMRPSTTINNDPAQAVGANLGVETYVSKPLTDNKLSAEEQKRAAQRAAYVPPAPVKVQAATEKNEAAVPALPQVFKVETIGAATESKPTESKTQPVATPTNPNAAKTKTD